MVLVLCRATNAGFFGGSFNIGSPSGGGVTVGSPSGGGTTGGTSSSGGGSGTTSGSGGVLSGSGGGGGGGGDAITTHINEVKTEFETAVESGVDTDKIISALADYLKSPEVQKYAETNPQFAQAASDFLATSAAGTSEQISAGIQNLASTSAQPIVVSTAKNEIVQEQKTAEVPEKLVHSDQPVESADLSKTTNTSSSGIESTKPAYSFKAYPTKSTVQNFTDEYGSSAAAGSLGLGSEVLSQEQQIAQATVAPEGQPTEDKSENLEVSTSAPDTNVPSDESLAPITEGEIVMKEGKITGEEGEQRQGQESTPVADKTTLESQPAETSNLVNALPETVSVNVIALGDQGKHEVIALGSQSKHETIILGSKSPVQTIVLGNQENPDTIILGSQNQPDVIILGNQTKPETVVLGNQTKPETVALGNQTKPETVILGSQTLPSTVVIGEQEQTPMVCVGSGCKEVTPASTSTSTPTPPPAPTPTPVSPLASATTAPSTPSASTPTDTNTGTDTDIDTQNEYVVVSNAIYSVTPVSSAAISESTPAVSDNPASLKSATLAIAVENPKPSDTIQASGQVVNEQVNVQSPAVVQIEILSASEAELTLSVGPSAIDFQLKTANAKAVEFYSRKGIQSSPIYLGNGIDSAGVWEYQLNLKNSPLPNGNYYFFAQINKGDGKIYRSTDIYAAISVIMPADSTKQIELKQDISKSSLAIEESQKVIDQTSEQTAAAAVFGGKNIQDIKEKMNSLAELVKTIERLNQLLFEKNDEKQKIETQITLLETEIRDLPPNTIALIRTDKTRLVGFLNNRRETINQEIETLQAAIKQKIEEKNQLAAQILAGVKDEAERNAIVETLNGFEQEILRNAKDIVENRKILFKDSDSDGLYDEFEITIGTDPFGPDTDGDGILDADEVANGYDPNTPDRFLNIKYGDPRLTVPKQTDIYRFDEKEAVNTVETPDGGTGIRFSGFGLPNAYITLFIYSSPVVVVVKTDEYGRWTYTLDKPLEDGQHTAYAALTNSKGEVEARSEVLVFVKNGGTVNRAIANQEASMAASTQGLKNIFSLVMVIAIALALSVGLIVVGLVASKGKKE